jgi:hypothetical protein
MIFSTDFRSTRKRVFSSGAIFHTLNPDLSKLLTGMDTKGERVDEMFAEESRLDAA